MQLLSKWRSKRGSSLDKVAARLADGIVEEKALHNEAQSPEIDPDRLRQIVGIFYGRILELLDSILALREERASLIAANETMERDAQCLTERQARMEGEQASAKEYALTLEMRVDELGETAAKLTAWNGALEEKIGEREEHLQRVEHEMATCLQQSQKESLAAANKLIALRGVADRLEEELIDRNVLLCEAQQMLDKVQRENAVMKSKLYPDQMYQRLAFLASEYHPVSVLENADSVPSKLAPNES